METRFVRSASNGSATVSWATSERRATKQRRQAVSSTGSGTLELSREENNKNDTIKGEFAWCCCCFQASARRTIPSAQPYR